MGVLSDDRHRTSEDHSTLMVLKDILLLRILITTQDKGLDDDHEGPEGLDVDHRVPRVLTMTTGHPGVLTMIAKVPRVLTMTTTFQRS